LKVNDENSRIRIH
jgi:hypothetical protein